MDNKSTTKRMIGAVVLVLIAALLLAWLLKGKNKSVQDQQQAIAEQTQDASPILGFPGVKENTNQQTAEQRDDAPYVIGGTDAQQNDSAVQQNSQNAQNTQQAVGDNGNLVGDKLAGAATAGKDAVKNLTDNFQVRDADGKQRQVVADGEVKNGTGSMGSSEIALPNQNSTDTTTGAQQSVGTDNGNNSGNTAQNTVADNTQSTQQATGNVGNNTSQTAQQAPEKQQIVNPRLVDEKPVPAPRTQRSVAAQAPQQNTVTSSSSTTAQSAPAVVGNGYAIQVLAASSRNTAERVRRDIAADGYPVFVVKANVNGKTVYRVRVGTYPARSAARAVQAKMKARYTKNQYVQNSFVTKN